MKTRTSTAFYVTLLVIFSVSFLAVAVNGNGGDPFHSKEEMISMFKELCDDHPQYTSYESVGKTYEGREILMFRIGNPEGGKVLWDGQMHGSEDKGSETIYLIAKWLLESGDSRASQILENNCILFIPIVNVDSYNRANRNFENCRWGVNLNRNFETGWSRIACSSDQNYAGPYPASEPETQVMRRVFQEYSPTFYVNVHCGSGPFLSYYRDSNLTLANEVIAEISEISREMGVIPYRTTRLGSTGFGIGDAASFGISSWLLEMEGPDTCWQHSDALYRQLVDVYYPKCLAIFLAMCRTCEVETPPPTVFRVYHNGEAFDVAFESNSTVHDFHFSDLARSLTFNVTGPNRTEGFCNVAIPDSLLWGKFSIYKDGAPLAKGVDYTQQHNGTHHIFQIAYSHTTHEIEITGTEAIPELPIADQAIVQVMLVAILSIAIIATRLLITKAPS